MHLLMFNVGCYCKPFDCDSVLYYTIARKLKIAAEVKFSLMNKEIGHQQDKIKRFLLSICELKC